LDLRPSTSLVTNIAPFTRANASEPGFDVVTDQLLFAAIALHDPVETTVLSGQAAQEEVSEACGGVLSRTVVRASADWLGAGSVAGLGPDSAVSFAHPIEATITPELTSLQLMEETPRATLLAALVEADARRLGAAEHTAVGDARTVDLGSPFETTPFVHFAAQDLVTIAL